MAFEEVKMKKSTRKNKSDWVVGYYVSFDIARVVNARAPSDEQVSEVQLYRLVLIVCNARLCKPESLERHKKMDDIILASDGKRPTKVTSKQWTRQEQIQKHATHPAFIERAKSITNGEKLLKRIQDTLDVLVAKYSPNSVTTRSQAAANAATSTDTPVQAKPGATISPVAKTAAAAKPKSAKAAARSLFPATNAPTIDSIKSETGCHRAYEIFLSDPVKFTFYLVYFKNVSIDLATEISRRCKCKQKVAIREWIRVHVGPIPDSKAVRSGAGGRSPRRAFYSGELRNLALVATALTVYGEAELSILLDSKSLEAWQNIALVSDEARNNPTQLECLKRAGVSGMKRTYHAAHYLGLDLAIRWNNTLAPECRLSAECFFRILNFQCNIKAVQRRVNVKDHSIAERFIVAFIPYGSQAELKSVTWPEARNINDRCVEIAKKAQSQEIREALFEAGGEQFYLRIKQTFEQIEVYFAQRGFTFGKIWDQQEDGKTRGSLLYKQLKSVINERHEEHKSPGPELLA